MRCLNIETRKYYVWNIIMLLHYYIIIETFYINIIFLNLSKKGFNKTNIKQMAY